MERNKDKENRGSNAPQMPTRPPMPPVKTPKQEPKKNS